jgi:diguanylate cyclase (GGDEF)-like protein/putative nucleotidyltransferase with HDIG domain
MENQLNLPSEADIKRILTLDDKKLPSFPQVAVKLMEASKDETVSLTDLAKILETDPGISARVLEIVNSAFYGIGRQITKLSEAVPLLGLNEIKKIALGMTVFEKMFKSGRTRQFDRLLFWRHSLSVAVLSLEIARKTGYKDPEEAYIAGLLHDVGKIFLDISGKQDYGSFIQELSSSTELIIEKERNTLGLGHDDIGAFFCSLWKLPEKLIMTVKYHHQPFDHMDFTQEDKLLISIVSLANFLCWTQGIGSFDFIRPPILPPEVETFIDLEKIDVVNCILQMNKEIESISEFYQFVFPSANQLKENLLWANLKLSKANTRYYYQEDPFKQIQATTSTRDTMEIGKPLARAKTIKEVLDIVMYQVGRIFEPLHWSILLKDPKSEEMVFSLVVGANKKKLQGVKLRKGEGVAGHIMKTGESLIIKDVSTDNRFSIRVDNYTKFKTQSIIGTPLKTGDKCFGVIELINRINDAPFSDDDLQFLSSIAEYAAIAIERSYYNQALTNMATKDSLTGLKNRWSFERAISNKDAVLKQYGSIFTMLIISADGVLQMEEAENHPSKDTIFKEIAQALMKTKRNKDIIFRYGEETFILLLPLTFADDAEIAKHRIKKEVTRIINEKLQIPIKITITPHTVSPEDAGKLKKIVADFLFKSKATVNEEPIGKIEDNIQPLFEQENKQESAVVTKAGTFGKSVSLSGNFVRLKTGESGHIRVEQISLEAIGCRISRSHHIQINDFLDIRFFLDDIKKSLIKRRGVVREIKGNYIKADFYNPPPFAKNLGFYMLS